MKGHTTMTISYRHTVPCETHGEHWLQVSLDFTEDKDHNKRLTVGVEVDESEGSKKWSTSIADSSALAVGAGNLDMPLIMKGLQLIAVDMANASDLLGRLGTSMVVGELRDKGIPEPEKLVEAILRAAAKGDDNG